MTKMATMPIYMVKTLQKSSPPESVDRFQRDLAHGPKELQCEYKL